jgi:hypothetical protein
MELFFLISFLNFSLLVHRNTFHLDLISFSLAELIGFLWIS